MSDLDLPFEGQEPTETDLGHGHTSGGVVILAAVMDLGEAGKMPTLVYRFAKPDGTGFYPPISLVIKADQAEKLVELTRSAVTRAVEVAARS